VSAADEAAAPTAGDVRAGAVLLLLVSLIWGVTWPITKVALWEMPVWHFRAATVLVGGIGVMAVAWAAGFRLLPSRREVGPLLLAALFNITLWTVLSAYGVALMGAGRSAIIAFTMPLWAAVLSAVFLGERMTVAKFASLALGVCGLAILVLPEWRQMAAAPAGFLVLLGSAVAWAIGTVIFKATPWRLSTFVLGGWQLLLGGLPLPLGAIAVGETFDPGSLTWAGLAAVGFIVLFAYVLGQWGWLQAVRMLPATVASIGLLTVPAIGVASSALMVGETPVWSDLAALVLVSAAVALVLTAGGRRSPNASRIEVPARDSS
jgi:drug/metabolite transporter (DMT)-like permease